MRYEDESIGRGAAVLDAHTAASAPPQPARPKLVSLEIGQLLAHSFPVQEPLLAPWLRKQTLAMVHAWRGIGKTHFGLGVAYAVATGTPFLGWKAEQPRKVLYLDGEMPGAAIQDRMTAIVASHGGIEPPHGHFRIVTPDAQDCALPDLSTKQGQIAYADVIADADLIVVDNLSSLARSGVENEGESWIPIAEWALALRREGRAVLFVHHEGKNGQQRGASRREDLLDVVVALGRPSDYREQEGARFVVQFKKARGLRGTDVDEIEAMLTVDAHGLQQWAYKPAEDLKHGRILELLQLGMGDAAIAEEIGCNRSTVYRARKRATAAGEFTPKSDSTGTS